MAAERSVAELCPGVTLTGFGYMRVGLRCLASQGWLATAPTLDPETTTVRWTDAGHSAARYWDRYVAAGRFLAEFPSNDPDAWSRPWDAAQTASFLDLVALACDGWRLGTDLPGKLRALIMTHLNAARPTTRT